MNFKPFIPNYNGYEYESHINKMKTMSITKPTQYGDMRVKVIEKLKSQMMTDVFNNYYDLLTDCDLYKNEMEGNKPSYPRQKAFKFAQGIVDVLDEVANKCIEIILPNQHDGFANLQNAIKALGGNLTIPPSLPNATV